MILCLRTLLLIGVWGGLSYAFRYENYGNNYYKYNTYDKYNKYDKYDKYNTYNNYETYYNYEQYEGVQNALTFNANLRRLLENPADASTSDLDRRNILIGQLQQGTQDVVCLQGVIYVEDTVAIVDGVSGAYNYSFSSLHNDAGQLQSVVPPLCDQTLFDAAVACTTTATVCTEYTNCAECDAIFANFIAANGDDCDTCLGSGGFGDAINYILGEEAPPYNVACFASTPLTPPEVPDGLLLLSKCELTDTEFVPFHEGTDEVGYLTANVCGSYNVICTHLTSEYDANAPLQDEFLTYADQTADEASQLIEEYADNANYLLLGDFGVGGPGSDFTAEFPGIYDQLTEAFTTNPNDLCDFCIDPINPFNPAGEGSQVSHIFSTNFVRILSTERVFATTDVNTTSGLPLSDHFGQTSQFVPAGYRCPLTPTPTPAPTQKYRWRKQRWGGGKRWGGGQKWKGGKRWSKH